MVVGQNRPLGRLGQRQNRALRRWQEVETADCAEALERPGVPGSTFATTLSAFRKPPVKA